MAASSEDRLCDRGRLAGDGGHDAFFGGFGAGDVDGEAALAHDEDAVAHTEDFGEFGGDHDVGDALFGEVGDQGVDLGLGADNDAAARFVEDEDADVLGEGAGDLKGWTSFGTRTTESSVPAATRATVIVGAGPMQSAVGVAS